LTQPVLSIFILRSVTPRVGHDGLKWNHQMLSTIISSGMTWRKNNKE